MRNTGEAMHQSASGREEAELEEGRNLRLRGYLALLGGAISLLAWSLGSPLLRSTEDTSSSSDASVGLALGVVWLMLGLLVVAFLITGLFMVARGGARAQRASRRRRAHADS